MELRNREPIISKKKETNPFEHDLLNREKYAHILTNIIRQYPSGFVMAIDNKWGTGKTTFVKMWIEFLNRREFETIYYNAWENDYQDEVIISILSELKKIKGESEELFANVLKKALPLLKSVGVELFKHSLGKVTGDKAIEIIAKGIGEYSLSSLEQGLDDFEKKRKSIEEFKIILGEFVKSLNNDNPIIFVIDELDRCRPNYSVEVLEKMKHLFNVPGIVFVLSIDKIQLGHAIRGVYGSDFIDSDEYLRRFIDFEFSIPKPEVKEFTVFLIEHFKLYDYYSSPERKNISMFEGDLRSLEFMLNLISQSSNVTLRQLEKILGLFSMVVKTLAKNTEANPMVLLFVIYLKITAKDSIYNKIVNRKLSMQELIDKSVELLFPLHDEALRSYFLWFQSEILVAYWKYIKEKKIDIELFTMYPVQNSFKLHIEGRADDEYHSLAESVKSIVGNRRKMSRTNFFTKILPHIELTESIS